MFVPVNYIEHTQSTTHPHLHTWGCQYPNQIIWHTWGAAAAAVAPTTTLLYTQIHNRVTGILIFNDCSPHFPPTHPPIHRSLYPPAHTTIPKTSQHLVVLAIQSNIMQPSLLTHSYSHFILLTFPFFPLFKYLISARWYIDTIYFAAAAKVRAPSNHNHQASILIP